ncbi:uncharacterized protein METZ01_LOCUS95016 [marine metagenome]|uniref:Uncharacterized protein n=1 Tax=marine metagenome TaxID=408172 RepID=A0A381VPG1_9ZZZZ
MNVNDKVSNLNERIPVSIPTRICQCCEYKRLGQISQFPVTVE